MSSKMKALVKEKCAPGATIKQVDIPKLGPHEVLVEVMATSICGTDLHIYNWNRWAASRIQPPVILGHEMSGNIVKVGSAVKSWHLGDYVSLECHFSCGICYQCRTGRANICRNCNILGVNLDGCFANYVRVPENNLWKNNSNLPPEIACLQDPIGNAVLATSSIEMRSNTVMVTGCGPIGLFTTGVCRVGGASKIYAVDYNEYRLQLARQMGAAYTINPLQLDPVREIWKDTGGEGVDAVMEMSGSEERLQDGLKAVKNGGIVSLLGIPKEKVSLDLADDVIFKGITLTGISGREIFNTWYITSALVSSLLDAGQVITHRLKLEEYEEAFSIMQSGKCGKIILYP